MTCLYCKKEIPDSSIYCNWCGRKQTRSSHRQPNGAGTVYKRGQTWTAKIRYWDGEKFASKTKGRFRTKKEAYAAVPGLLAEVKLNKTERISFVNLWQRLQTTERFLSLSQSKKDAWKYAYEKCKPLHGVKDFREIRYEHLQPLLKGLNYYPARDIKVMLSALYQLAEKYELCDKNYARMLELPKLNSKEKEIFTNEELSKIWNCTDPFRDYILIMCYCGLRPVEMRKLKKEDMHLEDEFMTGGQKTDLSKRSRIAIPNILVPILENFQPFPLGKSSFEKRFANCLRNAGIDRKLTPGCCRHTFVTLLTSVESSTAMIQKAARHTRYETTLNYTHIPIEDVKATVNKLSTPSTK